MSDELDDDALGELLRALPPAPDSVMEKLRGIPAEYGPLEFDGALDGADDDLDFEGDDGVHDGLDDFADSDLDPLADHGPSHDEVDPLDDGGHGHDFGDDV